MAECSALMPVPPEAGGSNKVTGRVMPPLALLASPQDPKHGSLAALLHMLTLSFKALQQSRICHR